jgi:ribonuclease HI
LAAAKEVLRYLKGRPDLGITYRARCDAQGGAVQGDLEAFCDASYAEDPGTRRSTSGYCVFLEGGLIAWKTGKQEVVATSSTEAEYVAYTHCIKELKWLRGTLDELKQARDRSTPLWSDSQSAIAMAHSEGYRAKTKHIDVRYHFIRESVKTGEISLDYRSSEDMPADGLTKPLVGAKWKSFVKLLNVGDIDIKIKLST